MKVKSKDVEQLGITTIECADDGSVVAVKGKLKGKKIKSHKMFLNHKFSIITDKTIHWAELELDYAGG